MSNLIKTVGTALAVNPFTTTIPKLENVTDKYTFVDTGMFIQDVESLGYSEVKSERRYPRRGLGMHSMVFTHPGLPKADGLSMRLLATNSHDATSAFRLFIQVLVQVCSNGMVAWRSDGSTDARVIHRGYAIDKVALALEAVHGKVNGVLEQIEALRNTQLSLEQTALYVEQASALRDSKPFRMSDLQRTVFTAQADNNAWNVLNRTQYSLINGGYQTRETVQRQDGTTIDVPGRKARELTAVRERVAVNTKLWDMSIDAFLKAKADAAKQVA
jgi:hypothetical protein